MDQESLHATFRVEVEGDLLCLTYVKAVMDETEQLEMVKLLDHDVREVFAKDPSKYYLGLVDLTPIQHNVSVVPGSVREIYGTLLQHEQLKKVALFGLNTFYEVGISFILSSLYEKDRVRIFKTQAEARAWLRE